MPATPSIETSQADLGVVSAGGGNAVTSQSDVTVVFNIPSEEVQVAQADNSVVSLTESAIEVSQLDLVIIYQGRVNDPAVRAWTFTLDGHDFYVLRLGNEETLIYDMTTEQWSQWSTAEEGFWSVYTGTNWVGGNRFSSVFGSNIVVGSDANGSVFFLDPNKPDDDAVVAGRTASPFRRRVTGQLPVRGYDSVRVYEVQLLGSVSDLDPGALTGIELLYSDDRGESYVSAGEITTVDQDFDIRANWRSLGSFRSPGRLFRVEDFGALKRIDSLTVSTSMDNGA